MANLKAYIYHDEYEGTVELFWAETRNQARDMVTYVYDIAYKDVRVRRAKWADEYGDVDNIPMKVWLDNGYAVPCEICGNLVYEEDCVYNEDLDSVCCFDCSGV